MVKKVISRPSADSFAVGRSKNRLWQLDILTGNVFVYCKLSIQAIFAIMSGRNQ
jgi:hypothetical protein